MHKLLHNLLKKRGISKEELTVEEKQDFDRWERILGEGEMSLEKITKFCENQLNVIELQWKNMDNDTKKNERLIIAHNIYSTLLKAIKSPVVERITLEDYLNQLIK